jgi:hypothetical protein
MITTTQEGALEAEANSLVEARNTSRVLGIIGRLLLAAAGLAIGSLAGLIGGVLSGLIPFAIAC